MRRVTMVAALVAALMITAGIALAECFRGDEGPNTITGTNDADRIDGLAGDDLYGLGGADDVFGFNGRDTISAGRCDDYGDVQGDGGADEVSCGSGRDVVHANPEDHLSDDCEVAKGEAGPR